MNREDALAVVTTQHAAKLLGLSISTVQQLVERGALDAWKTSGGHRRISRQSLEAYKDARLPQSDESSGAVPTVLVVEDHPLQLQIYQQMLRQWALPLDARFCDSGLKALISIARQPPDILLTDILMEGIDGFALLRAVLEDPRLSNIHIALITSLTAQELSTMEKIPARIAVFHKPVNGDELRGFLKCACAMTETRGQLPGRRDA
jgi:excisionase family DNA binding protein